MPATTKAGMALWAALWSTPQAAGWDLAGDHHAVAWYVRACMLASRPRATAGAHGERRQQAEHLGLTEAGLRRRRWVIGDAPAQQAPDIAQPTGTEGPSMRDRLKVVT